MLTMIYDDVNNTAIGLPSGIDQASGKPCTRLAGTPLTNGTIGSYTLVKGIYIAGALNRGLLLMYWDRHSEKRELDRYGMDECPACEWYATELWTVYARHSLDVQCHYCSA